jgi:hypothetical protein
VRSKIEQPAARDAACTFNMNNLKLAVIGGMVAGLATLWVIQHQTHIKLREENDSLRQRLDQMDQLEAENERLSNLVARANGSLSDEQLKDLLRLRSEVGSLRQQTNELARLREENRRLQATLMANRSLSASNSPPDATPQEFPKESWAFAGYATPSAALQSLYWATSKGDVKLASVSVTPEWWQREFGDTSESEIAAEFAKESSKVTGFRILSSKILSDNEVILNYNLASDGRSSDGNFRILMVKIEGEWKFAGPISPNSIEPE